MPPDKRIYAWGLRNPWRFWIDPETDLLWIGDVGEAAEEEITVGGKGANHGWPFYEGKTRYPAPLGGLSDCKQMTPSTDCTAPQEAYTHDVGRIRHRRPDPAPRLRLGRLRAALPLRRTTTAAWSGP